MASAKVVDINSKMTLSDGTQMPYFGFGTYLCAPGEGGAAVKSVEYALSNGYRMIDTAQYYKNEAEVGQAIKNSGVPREEIYVVTKLSIKGDVEQSKKTFMESLKKLDTGYIDLYLIHTPAGGHNIDAYKAMMEMQGKGLVKTLGVSNFGYGHLEQFKKAGMPTPVVNQIELHTFCRHEKTVDYCRKNGIALMGFCPLARGKYFNEPLLVELSNKYKKSPAQVMLRWSLQNDFITIPKSETPERIKANADVFDFELSKDDMKKLNLLPTDQYVTPLRLDVPCEM